MNVDKPISTPPTLKTKSGSTLYIVSAEYSKTTTENAVDKIRRILLKDCDKVS